MTKNVDELLLLALEKAGIPAYRSERLVRKGLAKKPALPVPEDIATRNRGIRKNIRKHEEFLASLTPAQRKDLAMPPVQERTMAQCLESDAEYIAKTEKRLENEEKNIATLEYNILHASEWEMLLFKAAIEGERARRKALRQQRKAQRADNSGKLATF